MALDLPALEQQHADFIKAGLKLDLTRGKPSFEQLDLSNALLESIDASLVSKNNDDGVDLRNYGGVNGLKQSKVWFADILGLPTAQSENNIFVGGNSSLSLMHFSLWLAFFIGFRDNTASWQQEAQEKNSRVKMLCPVPGYDRHFALCEQLGIEMIPVALTGSGPDIDQVQQLVSQDPMIKGIWCVPRFSNPTGEVYSEATVTAIAQLGKIAGNNFLVFWDNAYAVHVIENDAPVLSNIAEKAAQAGCEDSILQFASSSKMTFAGAGLAALASSQNNIQAFNKHFGLQSIGPDKINQLRHTQFLPSIEAIHQHMAQHAAILKPKFDTVDQILKQELGQDNNLGKWTKPTGGYFFSFDSQQGLAKTIIDLAAEAGVKLTPAGATFPYGRDPNDCNIRLAPSYPNLEELTLAMKVFCNCVKLATTKATI